MSLELEGIRLDYGSGRGLDDVGFSVGPGEFVALVGPSGAGKTTLLRIIGGLARASAGRVLRDGVDLGSLPARKRNIGFVFQDYALFPHLSVAGNVAFGLKVRPRRQRPSRAEQRARVAELLALVQVGELAEARPATLSGGQSQRVALARALATDPSLLLLDEPFGALDPLVRRDIRVWLRALQQRLGLTTVMVTHDRQEAMEIADRVAVLRGGRLLQIDTPARLEAAPADAFVMRFLGETLEFPGHVAAGVFRPASAAIAPVAAPADATGEAIALIRPWQVRLSPAPEGATVGETHPAGAFHRIALGLPGGGAELEILSPAELPAPARGQRMRIELLAPHLFAPDGRPIR